MTPGPILRRRPTFLRGRVRPFPRIDAVTLTSRRSLSFFASVSLSGAPAPFVRTRPPPSLICFGSNCRFPVFFPSSPTIFLKTFWTIGFLGLALTGYVSTFPVKLNGTFFVMLPSSAFAILLPLVSFLEGPYFGLRFLRFLPRVFPLAFQEGRSSSQCAPLGWAAAPPHAQTSFIPHIPLVRCECPTLPGCIFVWNGSKWPLELCPLYGPFKARRLSMLTSLFPCCTSFGSSGRACVCFVGLRLLPVEVAFCNDLSFFFPPGRFSRVPFWISACSYACVLFIGRFPPF